MIRDPEPAAGVGERLFAARRDRQRLEAGELAALLPDMGSAYAAQAALLARLRAAWGGERIGYKIGCTSQEARDMLGVAEPFFGEILAARLYTAPAVLNAADYDNRIFEVEFGIELGADLTDIGRPHDADSVRPAIASVFPAVELVDSVFTDWTTAGVKALVADNGCNYGWVRGTAACDWRRIDLDAHPSRLIVNGAVREQGSAAKVYGGPLRALAWLANALIARGRHLRAGEIVSTGASTQVYSARPGDEVVADYGAFGEVRVRYV